MVALPDTIVLATTPLSPAGWDIMNRHPVVGAALLDELFVVAAAADIVRAHHERWDGGGYPDGRGGDAIPLLSRVIATCDAFVAMASDRPYRRGLGAEVALAHVVHESGSQFEPRMVEALVAALAGESRRRATAPSAANTAVMAWAAPGVRRARVRDRALASASAELDVVPACAPALASAIAELDVVPACAPALASAIAEFDVVPAFVPAHERLLAATATDSASGGELVAAIESDTGLTVAVLRRAQAVAGRRPIENVADAVAALSPTEITDAIKALPRAEFPWRTTQLEVLMHRSRVHAQAVARAADRIARKLELVVRDDVLVAALLHDIGKLVLGRAFPEYSGATERTTTPEERVRREQRDLGVDHASVGGLLLRRWGLPTQLASTIAAHHSSEAEHDVSTYVRLADMIVHHAQGETIDRRRMLRLAHASGLSANALTDVMFDLPRISGSQRRRAEASPLSSRETAILRILAQGNAYKAIALDLGISASTVRSHLHNMYPKLGVSDRAQAVLRATEMGWI
jgi:putative nucleotidyltransferase with HDIG domain